MYKIIFSQSFDGTLHKGLLTFTQEINVFYLVILYPFCQSLTASQVRTEILMEKINRNCNSF